MMASRGIPLSFPTPLADLNKLVKSFGEDASDAAGAFVWLRNAIVHNDEKKREALKKAPARSRSQGRALGLWMVELIILAVAGYEYEYADRLNAYTVKPLPWSTQRITFAAAMADTPQPGASATATTTTNAPRSKPMAEETTPPTVRRSVKPRGRAR